MLDGINLLAVLVAGLAFFALGSVWYSVLGKTWAGEVGLDPEAPGGNMALIFGSALLLEILVSFVLALLVRDSGLAGWLVGVHFGLLASVGLAVPLMGVNYLFQRKSLKLFVIDAAHIVLGLLIVGAIVGAWR